MEYDDYLCVIEECEQEMEAMRAEITQLRADLEQALRAEEMYRRENHALTEDLAAERKLSSYLNDVARRSK